MEKKTTASRKAALFALIVAVSLIAIIALSVQAQASMGFSVEPHFPSNQRSNSGFFDLRLTPGQEQELSLTITNPTDTEISVVVEAFTVSTASNGSVDYSSVRVNDETLAHSISELITIPQPRVVIPAGSATDVTLQLRAPIESFEGILLGSLRISREPTEQELADAGAIVNRFAQAMAIVLSMDDREIAADFALGDISSQITNARASIVVNVRNPQPKLAKDVTAHTRIVELESDREIFTFTMESVDFAPNSVFPLTFLDRAGYGISAGNYRAYVTLEYEGQTWEMDREFQIEPAQAAAVNAAALNQNQQAQARAGSRELIDMRTLILFGGGALLAIIILVILIVSVRQRKKSNDHLLQMQMRILELQNRQVKK